LAHRRAHSSKSTVTPERLQEMAEIERAACLFRDEIDATPQSLVSRVREFIGRGGLAALE
jgi:hypothetical protein